MVQSRWLAPDAPPSANPSDSWWGDLEAPVSPWSAQAGRFRWGVFAACSGLLLLSFILGSDKHWLEPAAVLGYVLLVVLFNPWVLLTLFVIGLIFASRALFPTSRLLSVGLQLMLMLLAWIFGATEFISFFLPSPTDAAPAFTDYAEAVFSPIILIFGLLNAALLATPEVVTAESN